MLRITLHKDNILKGHKNASTVYTGALFVMEFHHQVGKTMKKCTYSWIKQKQK